MTGAAAKPAAVLLVDDDDDLREELAALLDSAGYRVVQATSGSAAIQTLHHLRPDLVITDVIMPGEDGIGLLRSRREIGLDAPVIVITGGSSQFPGMDLTKIAEMMGAQVALSKPFEPQTLLFHAARLLAARATA